MWQLHTGTVPAGFSAAPSTPVFHEGKWLARRAGDGKVMSHPGLGYESLTKPVLLGPVLRSPGAPIGQQPQISGQQIGAFAQVPSVEYTGNAPATHAEGATNNMLQAQGQRRARGFGAAGAAELADGSHITAAAVVQAAGFAPCTVNAQIQQFQTDYNTDNGVTLTVDGIYGANTDTALLAANGLTSWPGTVPICPPAGTGSTPSPNSGGGTGGSPATGALAAPNYTPLLVTAGVLGAGALAYYLWKAKKL
jgi:hypothetical protein